MQLPTIIAAVCLTVAAHGQTAAVSKKKTAAKATASKGAAAKSAVAKSAAKKAPASKASAFKAAASKTGAKSKRAVARRPAPQQQPTSDRYREIQQALADKGYFRGAVDGAWGSESVEALKRFQHEQNLDADGKLGALSLMALGLGPRRGTAAAQAADAAVDPPPVAQPPP